MSDEARGQAIKERRLRLGFKSVRAFAEASGVSRDAVTAAEEGTASTGTYDRLEAWLDAFDEETGNDEPEPAGKVRFSVKGNFGVAMTVEGPVENLEELEEVVARMIERMGNNGETNDAPSD